MKKRKICERTYDCVRQYEPFYKLKLLLFCGCNISLLYYGLQHFSYELTGFLLCFPKYLFFDFPFREHAFLTNFEMLPFWKHPGIKRIVPPVNLQ